jgi:hypothetical protein
VQTNLPWGRAVQGNLVVGVPLGLLIGVITAMMTLLILDDAFQPQTRMISWVERIFGRRQASGLRHVGKMATLITLWFGGGWLTTIVMSDLSWAEVRGPYLVALAVTYMTIVVVPLVRLIARVSRKIR